MNLKQFYNKKVNIVADSGSVYLGMVTDYFYPDDNESGKESIIVDTDEGTAVEFYEKNIKEIEIIK